MPFTTVLPLSELNSRFQFSTSEDILVWAAAEFGQSVTLACSFGAEDVVLVDQVARLGLDIPIFFLDTGRLHEETYETMERCRNKYRIEFEVYSPEPNLLQDLIRVKGPVSFYGSIENRRECCAVRKIEPLRRALAGKRAWVTGLRRDQSVTRSSVHTVDTDIANGSIVKINPLAYWSEEQVWQYIRSYDVPYNALHDRGFPSIGCAPCTRAISFGDDPRSGRWWWESPEQKECGLHVR